MFVSVCMIVELRPASIAAKVQDPAPTQVLNRKPFSDREIKEYQKTADVVTKIPWQLCEASSYLKHLVDMNVKRKADEPFHLQLLARRTPTEWAVMMPDEFVEWHDYAPGTPKAVTVKITPVRAKAKAAPPPVPSTTDNAVCPQPPVKRMRLSKKTSVPQVDPRAEDVAPIVPVPPTKAKSVKIRAPKKRTGNPKPATPEERMHWKLTGKGCSRDRWTGCCAACKLARAEHGAPA